MSRRVERTQTVPLLLRTPLVRAYLAEVAAEHGVEVEELRAEVEAVLTTWRSRDGARVPAFDELLAEEARATGRTVAAVRAQLVAELKQWVGSGR